MDYVVISFPEHSDCSSQEEKERVSEAEEDREFGHLQVLPPRALAPWTAHPALASPALWVCGEETLPPAWPSPILRSTRSQGVAGKRCLKTALSSFQEVASPSIAAKASLRSGDANAPG